MSAVSIKQANEERLAVMLNTGLEHGSFLFNGNVETMASFIFGLLEGGMLVAPVRGGSAQFDQTIEQLMLLIKS